MQSAPGYLSVPDPVMIDAATLKQIAFDLYERYLLLEQIGPLFRPSDKTYRILDVGGHTPALWAGFSSLIGAFVPGARVTVVDMLASAEFPDYVRASGLSLPFRDGEFDLVCSLDTLEHLAVESRPGFLSELLRVSRDGLYVAFPFDSATNRWAESVVLEYTRAFLNDPVPALLEHRQFGLPDPRQIADIFAASGLSWIGFRQGNTDVWLLMMLTYHALRRPGNDFVYELNSRFNRAYAGQNWPEPHYRAGYLLSKRRQTADLEAVSASFVTDRNGPDLQSVLALCHLLLHIGQDARVVADKDRHIRNIEADLADARLYRAKWGEVAALLGRLEAEFLGCDTRGAPRDAPADLPDGRMTALLEAAVERPAGNLGRELSNIGAQLEEIRGRFDGLAARNFRHGWIPGCATSKLGWSTTNARSRLFTIAVSGKPSALPAACS